jgi:hypothetical protein
MMHEFHAWIGLAQSPAEGDDELFAQAVDEIEDLVSRSKWHDTSFQLQNLNGQYFLTATGMVNRRREEGRRLDEILDMVRRSLPGSWGVIYERDDEAPYPPGPNAFRVRIIARGLINEKLDPFLSPCSPVIED